MDDEYERRYCKRCMIFTHVDDNGNCELCAEYDALRTENERLKLKLKVPGGLVELYHKLWGNGRRPLAVEAGMVLTFEHIAAEVCRKLIAEQEGGE